MAVLIQCHRITHSVGTKNLFHNLDLTISSGDRIGLVGHNGSGKSTLLSLLSGADWLMMGSYPGTVLCSLKPSSNL